MHQRGRGRGSRMHSYAFKSVANSSCVSTRSNAQDSMRRKVGGVQRAHEQQVAGELEHHISVQQDVV
jgi:hypothetical protein